MKFLHTADLHLGKKVNDFSMLDEQKHILNSIVEIAIENHVDGIFISGDIFDKSIQSEAALSLWNLFLENISKEEIALYAISGNHDSQDRIEYGAPIFSNSNIHIQGVYDEKGMKKISVNDEHGSANIFLLPFIKPIHARFSEEDENIKTYTDAVKAAIARENIPIEDRNILLTHQFVSGGETSDSEEMLSIGGSDMVDGAIFSPFDYVALGHLHRPQGTTLRYSGSPLKYSKSECNSKKSITLVEFKEKGNICIEEIPLVPMHDMTIIKGKYDEITKRSFYEGKAFKDDYLHIELEDSEYKINAIGLLRSIYPNILSLEFTNISVREQEIENLDSEDELENPASLVSKFYQTMTGENLDSDSARYVEKIIEEMLSNEN